MMQGTKSGWHVASGTMQIEDCVRSRPYFHSLPSCASGPSGSLSRKLSLRAPRLLSQSAPRSSHLSSGNIPEDDDATDLRRSRQRKAAADAFCKYFYLLPANTAALRERVFQLRYDVYVREFAYESAESCPEQLERDAYDEQARHCLLVHRPTGMPAGCVRIVLTNPRDRMAPLPFEKFCQSALRKQAFDSFAVNRETICEISRLAVPAHFRRRIGDSPTQGHALQDPSGLHDRERDGFPLIPVSLFLAAASMSVANGCHHAIAMMEPRLARMTRRFGLPFQQVGDLIDYHGPRAPYYVQREGFFATVNPEIYRLLLLIDQQLSFNAYDS